MNRSRLQIDRFIVAHAIMLALSGMPGIYFHSLFGSRGWPEGVALTGQNRTINRQKFDRAKWNANCMIRNRAATSCVQSLEALACKFDRASSGVSPHSPQRCATLDRAASSPSSAAQPSERVLCLHNVSAQPQTIQLDREWARGHRFDYARKTSAGEGALTLAPYQVVWLRPNDR